MIHAPADNRHQILALTGGGYRGVFSAAILEHCETAWDVSWCDRFQLFAGTSVGALLAAGLAAGRSAKELVAAMEKHGETIFHKRFLDGPRRLFGSASYATEPLRAAVSAVLGNEKDVLLSDFSGRLVVTAVNYSTGTTEIFTSAGLSGSRAPRVKLLDAIVASAAAPTYFPLFMIGRHEYADGGLVANAPDLVALIESMSHQRAALERSYMLSVGTASWSDGVALRQEADNPGTIAALWRRRLVQTTMAAQESLALHQIRVLMGERHLRIDREPDPRRAAEIGAMDNASPTVFAALQEVANETWRHWCSLEREQGDYRLRDFFAR